MYFNKPLYNDQWTIKIPGLMLFSVFSINKLSSTRDIAVTWYPHCSLISPLTIALKVRTRNYACLHMTAFIVKCTLQLTMLYMNLTGRNFSSEQTAAVYQYMKIWYSIGNSHEQTTNPILILRAASPQIRKMAYERFDRLRLFEPEHTIPIPVIRKSCDVSQLPFDVHEKT